MGKKRFYASPGPGTRGKSVTRSQFRNAVDAGVRKAGEEIYDYVPQGDIERLKDTATVIDAKAWQCTGSCGCPMTALGVVTTQRDEAGGGTPPRVVKSFAQGYDAAMGSAGIGHAAVVEITD